MTESTTANNIRLGLFVLVGLACLVITLFLLGRKQNLFSSSLQVQADFRNVSGLLTGNNVRLAGINVGTVRRIRILNDSTVRVAMDLNRDVRPYVKKNAIASIGTDGLVGNTIINLNASPEPAPPVVAGDILRTKSPLGIDAMLGTLNVSNKNLVGITKDLRAMTRRLNRSKALWSLLEDEQLARNFSHSMSHVAATTDLLQASARDVQLLTRGVRQGRGAAGYLFTDTAFAGQMHHATRQLAKTSDTLASTVASLKRQVSNPKGPLNTLLTDSTVSRQLKQSVENVAQGTAGFSQSMEALQHNFLLRGYFRRQKRKQAKQQQAAEKQPTPDKQAQAAKQ
ncbi:MlaD family protein [Hymenobacter sp. BT770]|uniref:MlaD family protein n=1 Tax=Hymenobacter sp. BT770 TaxID=2886942 RepID=UPI001D0FB20B|nr:MlaD family protein [Hymenobacter sp. BT770]MCC3155326.1 MlaD family protein [Hymenobacter sp. BT770]MDO3417359.1 MlaD family protein [Hymenobacter sp. BT770]